MEGFLEPSRAAELVKEARWDSATQFRRRDRADAPVGPTAAEVRHRFASAIGLGEDHLEPLRLVRYSEVGQSFEPHVDWIPDESDDQLAAIGQRVATGLLYLTSLPEGVGGETTFPELDLTFVPRAGSLLLWPNVDAEGRPLPETVHEARPLRSEGVLKVAANIWVRDRPLPTDEATLQGLLLS